MSEQSIIRHKQILEGLHKLYVDKNTAYGDSFTKSFDKYGPVSALVRMEDKFNRLNSLLVEKNENRVNNESVIDTFLDLANYCIMTVIELEKLKLHKENIAAIKSKPDEIKYICWACGDSKVFEHGENTESAAVKAINEGWGLYNGSNYCPKCNPQRGKEKK
jgi:hypothetical protein